MRLACRRGLFEVPHWDHMASAVKRLSLVKAVTEVISGDGLLNVVNGYSRCYTDSLDARFLLIMEWTV